MPGFFESPEELERAIKSPSSALHVQTNPLWHTLVYAVVWQQLQRNNSSHEGRNCHLIRGINAEIIITCYCIIEGFLEEALLSKQIGEGYSKKLSSKSASPMERIKFILQKVLFGCLKKHKTKYQQSLDLKERLKILGAQKVIRSNDLWKSIQILRQLRHFIVHGNLLKVKGTQKVYPDHHPIHQVGWGKDFSMQKKHKHVEDFLLEKKLIPHRMKEGGRIFELLSDNVADYFVDATEMFLKNIFLCLPRDRLFFFSPIGPPDEKASEAEKIAFLTNIHGNVLTVEWKNLLVDGKVP